MSLSKHSFIGRLTKAPEGRDINAKDGTTRVANFTVAVDPEIQGQESDFYVVVVWRKLAETCERFLDKGRLVYVEGRPRTRSYDVTRDGVTFKQYVTEVTADKVQFLDRGNTASNEGTEAPEEASAGRPPF